MTLKTTTTELQVPDSGYSHVQFDRVTLVCDTPS